jgi:hypothetical protein
MADLEDKVADLVARGREEFHDFDRRSEVAVACGVDRHVLDALSDFPDAHRIVARLADDPARAAAILSDTSPGRLGVELGRLAERIRAEAKKAAAPAPAPKARSLSDPDITMPEFVKLREAQRSERRRK